MTLYHETVGDQILIDLISIRERYEILIKYDPKNSHIYQRAVIILDKAILEIEAEII